MMDVLRKSWTLSYLVIAAFGGLIANQGCGGGNHSMDIGKQQEAYFRNGIRLSSLKMPKDINLELPERWSGVDCSTDGKTVLFNNGAVNLQVVHLSPDSRTHQDQGAIEIPWVDKCGFSTKWFYYAHDTGHPFPDENGITITLEHWNFCLYDTWAEMIKDAEESTSRRARMDAHVWIDPVQKKLKMSFSKPSGIKLMKPCSSREGVISFDEAADMAIEAMKAYWQQIRSELGPVGEKVVAVVLIAAIIVALYYVGTAIAAFAASLGFTTILGFAVVAAAPPPPDDGSSGGSTGSTTTPDTTPPNVLTDGCRVEPTGDGKFVMAVAFDAADFNSGWIQLQDTNGVNHGIGGQNWTNPIVLEHNMAGWPYGLYKVMTWAKILFDSLQSNVRIKIDE